MSQSRSEMAERAARIAAQFGNTMEAVAAFEANMQQSHLAAPVQRNAPGGIVRRIARSAARSPKTAGEAEVHDMMRRGFDPATGKYFETATDAANYRRATGLAEMSKRDLECEAASRGSSLKRLPELNKNVKGYNPNAFTIGAAVAGGIT